MDAVLRIDLEALSSPIFNPLINACRAVAVGGPREDIQFTRLLQRQVCHFQVNWLVFLMIGVGQKDGRLFIETHNTIRFWILNLRALISRQQAGGVGFAMFLCAKGRPTAKQCGAPHINTAEAKADDRTKL